MWEFLFDILESLMVLLPLTKDHPVKIIRKLTSSKQVTILFSTSSKQLSYVLNQWTTDALFLQTSSVEFRSCSMQYYKCKKTKQLQSYQLWPSSPNVLGTLKSIGFCQHAKYESLSIPVSENSTHSINDDWYSSEFWPLNNLLKRNISQKFIKLNQHT